MGQVCYLPLVGVMVFGLVAPAFCDEKLNPVENVTRPDKGASEEGLKADEEVARLQKIWADWMLKATSINVVGFEFFGRIGTDDLVSRQQLIGLIQETLPTVLKRNPELEVSTLTDATIPLFPKPEKENLNSGTFGRWAEISMVRDANNVKLKSAIDGHANITVRRGSSEQIYMPDNRQASVYTKNGGLRIPGIDTFIYAPTHSKLMMEGNHGSGHVLDYDPASGFVSYHGLRLSETQFLREHFQSDAVSTPGGIPVSRISTTINYDSRQGTCHVYIYVIKTVEIGKEVDRSEFDLSVPAGTNVVLFQGAPGKHPPGIRPPMARTKQGVNDAEQFTRSAEFQNAQR